jgi:hypothetical protein
MGCFAQVFATTSRLAETEVVHPHSSVAQGKIRIKLNGSMVIGQGCSVAFLIRHLQGNKVVQFYVLSFVDDAHPAAAQLLDNAVVRDSLAEHWMAQRLRLQ